MVSSAAIEPTMPTIGPKTPFSSQEATGSASNGAAATGKTSETQANRLETMEISMEIDGNSMKYTKTFKTSQYLSMFYMIKYDEMKRNEEKKGLSPLIVRAAHRRHGPSSKL